MFSSPVYFGFAVGIIFSISKNILLLQKGQMAKFL